MKLYNQANALIIVMFIVFTATKKNELLKNYKVISTKGTNKETGTGFGLILCKGFEL